MQIVIQILGILEYTAACKHVQCTVINQSIYFVCPNDFTARVRFFFVYSKYRVGTITLVARSGTYVNYGLVFWTRKFIEVINYGSGAGFCYFVDFGGKHCSRCLKQTTELSRCYLNVEESDLNMIDID